VIAAGDVLQLVAVIAVLGICRQVQGKVSKCQATDNIDGQWNP
jgi:hypothetical protein